MNNKNPRYVIYEILYDFFITKTSLKFIIEKYPFKKKDSAFIINVLKGILRNKKILDQNIYLYSKRKKVDLKSMILLYIGTYQLLYCDSVPDYAAINTTVDMSKSINIKSSTFINAILRNINRQPYKIEKATPIDIYYSYPKWFLEELKKTYKNEIHSICEVNSKEPPLWLRINTLKSSLDEILNILSTEKILFSQDEFLSNFIKLRCFDKKGILLNLIKEGKVYAQNPSSGFVVKLLNPFKNDTILDACSAPGGKASYIAELTKNKIDMTCMDINENRIEKMKKNFNVLKVGNVNLLNANANSIKNNKKYNKILLDLPCTSSGTIRKNPDIKWTISKDNLRKIKKIQYSILDNMKNSLKDRGEIVYSTCSILPEENNKNIIKFLNENSNFSIPKIHQDFPDIFKNKLGGITILPNNRGYEGMFAVKIKKNA